ncbi:hypothetical protein JCM10213_002421 [Rhodosporidiobolus nylandii]
MADAAPAANGAPPAAPADNAADSLASLSISSGAGAKGPLCMNGCGKPANPKLKCPVCLKNGVKNAEFCTPECFRENYKEHNRKMHVDAPPAPVANLPEGTYDPWSDPARLKATTTKRHSEPPPSEFKYTGSLRAVYPLEDLPRREVPGHIPRPDYANNAQGSSATEQAARLQTQGKQLSAEEIEGMRKVCRLAREVLDIAAAALRPGITTLEIDEIVHAECVKRDSYPSPLGYYKFPRSVCTSINEVICHGIPDARPLEDGDIVNLDVTLFHGGFHGDLNGTYAVGSSVPQQSLDLIACARECLDEAIRVCKPGFEYKELGGLIEAISLARGFTTNKTYCGHGINQLFHCAPNVPHYAGNRAPGTMKAGQTFTIEPMICVGKQDETHWPDNWTAVTVDGKHSAQFEETLLVTETGVEVLTAAPGWQLPDKKPDVDTLWSPPKVQQMFRRPMRGGRGMRRK